MEKGENSSNYHLLPSHKINDQSFKHKFQHFGHIFLITNAEYTDRSIFFLSHSLLYIFCLTVWSIFSVSQSGELSATGQNS